MVLSVPARVNELFRVRVLDVVPPAIEKPVLPAVSVNPFTVVKLGVVETFSVVEPPRATLPPPVRLVPAETVRLEFAKFALVIPADPERLLFVSPEIVFEPAAIVLFVSDSEPAKVERVPDVGKVNDVRADKFNVRP